MPIAAAAALVAGAVAAGGTAALWNADGGTPLGIITAGDLGIDLVEDPVWRETSQDVERAPRTIDAAFLARPGDTVTMEQRFTTELQGDNMLGRLTIDWSETPTLPEGVSATYSVHDESGTTRIESVGLGTSAAIENLDAGNHSRTDLLTLEVAITFDGMSDRFGPGDDEIADLGEIVIELDQVRTGEGS